jgi:hypothetical protein
MQGAAQQWHMFCENMQVNNISAGRSIAFRFCGGRKVRAAQGVMLPNGKIPVRVWQVEEKITAPVGGKGEKVR